MSLLRDIAYSIGATITAPVWATRMWRTGKIKTDWPARFGHVPGASVAKINRDAKTILIHAVSVGEVNAIRQLVDHLRASDSSLNIVISVTTDTGTARAMQVFADDHVVVRYPFDFSRSVNRFLDRVQPDVVALTELEVWPNFVGACAKRDVPVCIINGRLSERSFKGYRKIAPLLRNTFAKLHFCAVQNDAIAKRFIALGAAADRVEVFDTMKWDTANIADTVDGADELALAMSISRDRPVIVAGSTGPGEEQILIDLLATLPDDVQMVIVPRKPERFEEVAVLDGSFIRRSKCSDDASRSKTNARLFLLDTMGELRKAYALADIVIVGRSLIGMYGSDMMEPIALAKPTVIGPHYKDFAHIMAAFIEADGIRVATVEQLAGVVNELLNDQDRATAMAARGREVIRKRQGSTARHARMLLDVIKQTPPRQQSG